jgi:hypothetical protein
VVGEGVEVPNPLPAGWRARRAIVSASPACGSVNAAFDAGQLSYRLSGSSALCLELGTAFAIFMNKIAPDRIRKFLSQNPALR